jgi:hypothetical protein
MNYRWRGRARRQQLFQTALLRPPTIGPQPGIVGPGAPPTVTALLGGPITQETTLIEKGGHTVFLSPGVQVFLTKGLKTEFGLQIPIVKPSDAWAEDIVFHFGLMKYFF